MMETYCHLRSIKIGLFLVVVSCFILSRKCFVAIAEELQVDVAGNIYPTIDETATDSVTALFTNGFPDSDLVIHWDGDVERPVVAQLSPGENVEIQTFVNHRFYAVTLDPRPLRAQPTLAIISDEANEFTFTPRPSIPQHGKYNFTFAYLNQRSTSVNVRFRSLAPMIDMWYDGGGDEPSYQGSLALGQESNVNTYEGHVFFMTVGTKQREIVRYTIKADDVRSSSV